MVSLFDFFRGNSRSYPPSPPSPPVRNAGLGSPAVPEAATQYQILQGFLQLRGGVLLLLVPVFRTRGALRCQTSPRAHSCHRGYDYGPHAQRVSKLEATKPTLSLSLTLALARLRRYLAHGLRKRRQKQNLPLPFTLPPPCAPARGWADVPAPCKDRLSGAKQIACPRPHRDLCLIERDRFLVSLGVLSGKPIVSKPSGIDFNPAKSSR